MADVDVLARRMVGAFEQLARRGMTLAVGLAVMTAIVSLGAFAMGLAALEGSTRSAWLVIGGVMAVVTIGAPLLVAWRLGRIRSSATGLVDDVRTLLTRNPEAERIVIDTVEVEEGQGVTASPAVIGRTTQFSQFQRVVLSTDNLRTLPMAVRAVTTFPALLGVSVLFTLVFAILGFLFFIAWIF